MRHPPLPTLSLCLLLATGCNTGGGSSTAGPHSNPENALLDVDRDGVFDEVWVSDWDGDGTLETQDVQRAIDALQAAGPAPRMTIVVAGRVQGRLRASARIEVLPTGEVRGALEAPRIVLAEGSVVNGPCHSGDRRETPRRRSPGPASP